MINSARIFRAGILLSVFFCLIFGIDNVINAEGDPPVSSGETFSAARSVESLSLDERAAFRQKIEAIYWNRRTWNNPGPKPTLEEVLPLPSIRARVEDELRKSNALETIFRRAVTPEQLEAEVARMTRQTRDPEMLRELFAALENDSFLIAEILARPSLAETFLKDAYFADPRFQKPGQNESGDDSAGARDEAAFEAWWLERKNELDAAANILARPFDLPAVAPAADDTWETMVTTPAGGTDATAVWTGVEVIIWKGDLLRSGSRYNPALDMTFSVSRTNAPPQRTRHTAVWTGQEMIVWGGYNCSGQCDAFRTGYRYNPTTDAWTETSANNAPAARDEHVAVWTGTEMIVWGGWDPLGANLNSGGRYNPSTDTWTPTGTINAPSGRLRATAVWTGQEMIVWGGVVSNVGGQNTGGRYNPASDSWTPTSTTGAPSPRFAHTAVWTGAEMIVWGGGADGVITNTGGRYNPSTDTWSPMAVPALEPRRFHTAVWTGTEMIVFGGCTDVNCTVSRENGGRYNPSTDAWTPIAPAVGNNRSRHAAVWTGTEMIVAGGCRGSQCNQAVTNIVRYNPSTDSWREARYEPIVVTPRQPHQAVWTGTEMLVWGVDASTFDTSVYRFDPAVNRWTHTFVAGAPDPRSDFSLVWTGLEMIVWGGDVVSQGVSRTGARFNPSTNAWTPTGITNAPTSRFLHTAVWTGTEMIVWGGMSGSFLLTRTGSRYNPSTDTWTPITTTGAPVGRIIHTAVWTGTEMIVWGGNDGNGVEAAEYYNSGGRYNPSTNTWTPTSTTNAPSARTSHTAVWTGQEMIVWGGHTNAAVFNTGARYNPAADAWTPTSTTNAPSPRWIHTAVWTGEEMIVWGGITNNEFPFQSTNTGGRYKPSNDSWRPTSLVRAPDRRDAHTAVWTGSQMIVWGGVVDPVALYVNTGGIYNVETSAPNRTAFDFDGDGKADISIFRPSMGQWWYLKSSNGGNYAAQFGASNDKITAADFTGDGKTDIAFWRPSSGEWFVLRSEDGSYYSFPFGASGDVPAPGDYDGDSKTDAAVFRPSTSTWYVSKSTGGTIIQQFGQTGDVPVAADYDGDNKTDIAIYRVSAGEWWINRSTAGLIAFQFGNSKDKPVQGDFTGDGKADVALFRPNTGEWFVLRSENQSYYSFPFGTNGDAPSPGDYDGDGKTDAAVFRPSNNTWFVNRSTGGNLIQSFGQTGDRPVANAFVP